MIGLHECLILKVSLSDILNLRHGVLRAGLPWETAKFDGDDDRHTHHFAAYLEDGKYIVCCATFILNDYDDDVPAWQLRGMATEAGYRNRGIGAQLLVSAEARLRHNVVYDHIYTMWCNAREPSVDFYLQNGWKTVGDKFDIPTAGPHYKMVKEF